MANKKKRVVVFLIVILAVGAAAAGTWFFGIKPASAATTAESQEEVAVIPAKSGTVAVRVEGPSVVEPYMIQTIRSRIEGQIIQGPSEGDSFKEGDVIVRFDRTDLENSVRQAELGLAQGRINRDKAKDALAAAQADLAGKQRLFASGAISQEQVDSAREALTNAEYSLKLAELSVSQTALGLETARQNLASAEVKAPFSGVVLSSAASPGDLVSKNAPLFEYADVSRVRLRAEVDEFDIGKVQAGQSVSITSDTLGDQTLKSKVERVSPAAEVINNISIFRVSTVLNNEDGVLKPGMSADLSVLISSDKGIVVPSKAVSTVRTRSYVKVYEDGEIVTKRVTIGADDGVNVAVLEGLEEEELVVLPGGSTTFSLTSESSSSGASVVPISVPGTGGTR